MDSLEVLLEGSRTHQRSIYNINSDMPDAERRAYLTQMLLGLSAEVGELIQECDWKDWRRIQERRKAITEEAVDVLIFLANILVLYDIQRSELVSMLLQKRNRNAVRDGLGRKPKGDKR